MRALRRCLLRKIADGQSRRVIVKHVFAPFANIRARKRAGIMSIGISRDRKLVNLMISW